MQMDAIRLYCDIAHHRSFSKAAAAHGVTQSAASQRIQSLEKELSIRLIDRSKRPLELTAAGKLFHEGCWGIIDRYERLKRRVVGVGRGDAGPLTEPLRGEVTIAAIYSAGIDLLSRVKAGFQAEHPEARVRISYLQPEAVYRSVRAGRCDLGILSYPRQWRDLASVPLRDETMVVVGRAGHPLWASIRNRPAGPADLAQAPMVGFDPSLPINRRIRGYLRGHGVSPEIVNQFDNIDTIKMFVAETDAIALLPDRTVQREVSAGALAMAPLEPRMVRPVGIVYVRRREPGPLVRSFVDYLSNHQASQPAAYPSAAAMPV